jgi:pimeloyl-ACP methyl ester carboxylesterase
VSEDLDVLVQRFPSLGPHGFHSIAYTDWGSSDARVVVCVHGLTRNARDFDWLARALQRHRRVVCMDVAGRGESDWLEHKQDYTFRQYQADAAALIARVTARHNGARFPWLFRPTRSPESVTVDWIGTSMGGLIGLHLAAQPGSPIRRLVLNDVGPFVSWASLMRIKGHTMGSTGHATFEEAETRLREACAPWGPMSEAQQRHLARHSIRRREDGSYGFACDPRIADATAWGFSPEARVGRRSLLGLEMWSEWEQVRCPVLVLRGKQSDVLLPETVDRMRSRAERTEVVEFDGVGHAPSLMSRQQIEIVRRFLLSPD